MHGARILIAEDDFLIASELEDAVLRRGGMPVGPVASVADALRIVSADTLGAAILDVNLRDGVVDPVVEHLRQGETPFVLHTGEPRELIAERLGPASVLSKPVSADLVIDLVQNLLADR